MIGFAGGGYATSVDDITVKRDQDENGSYETTEHVEHFALGSDGRSSYTLSTDAAGNLTYDGIYQFSYDAWNRMVKVTNAWSSSDAGSVIDLMSYDGLGRRIGKQVQNCQPLDGMHHYYYDGQQMIEERDGSDQLLKQMVWGLSYIDELVEVGINADFWNASTVDHEENKVERYYWALQDANYNVLALQVGYMAERYEYTPYGQRRAFVHGWLPGDPDQDGNVTTSDYTSVDASLGTSDPNSIGDLDGDGQVTAGDYTTIDANLGLGLGTETDPQLLYSTASSGQRLVDTTVWPTAMCEFGHQGLLHDEETGLIYNRARMFHPTLGRFVQRDPAGYIDEGNLYHYVRSAPSSLLDPKGLAPIPAKPPIPPGKWNRPTVIGSSVQWEVVAFRADTRFRVRYRKCQISVL
jgi:RHS repeat-associated protein